MLERGDWNDVIKCSLSTVNLSGSSKREFEAISYVWGERSEDPPHILVDGRIFNVWVNLQAALRHFRSTTKTRTLWVDAICINQNHIQGRNQQVALMREIYHQCKRVLIWLGENGTATTQMSQIGPCQWKTDFTGRPPHLHVHKHDEERIRQFVARYKRYYELPFALRHHWRIDSVMGAYCLISLLAQNICLNQENFPFLSEEASQDIFQALGDIVSKPWWTRIWVVQELVLAPQAMVYCGNVIAPWNLYVHAARNYNTHRGTCCEDHYKWLQRHNIRLLEAFLLAVLEIEDLRQVWQDILRDGVSGDQNTRIYLRHLLWKFRNRVSSDPRDQVYALLSLVNSWGGERSMYVDYSVEMKTLYHVTAERTINADKSLLVLAGTMAKKEGRNVLPTWVPDWTTQPSSRFESERLQRIGLFKASNGAKMPELPVRVLWGSFLRLHGNCVDEVTNVSEVMTYGDRNLNKSCDTFASWYNFVTLDGPMTAQYVTGRKTRMGAYWRTLCMDTARRNTGKNASYRQGYEYQRCAPDYVQKSLDLWIDTALLPHPITTGETQHQNTTPSPDDDWKVTQSNHPSRDDRWVEPPKHDDGTLNYVEVDFAICSATMHRRIFVTRQGYLGLGPPEIQNGDLVYIFAGGHVPFIVRRVQDRMILGGEAGKSFELVGDCYVHGIMDGESMSQELGQKEAIWLV